MPHYQIALTITILADAEDDAREMLREFMADATGDELSPIEDYSIDETMEEY